MFAKDRLEAAVVRSGMTECEDARAQLGWAGYELLTSLAEQQLKLKQSVILDSVASTSSIRAAWRALACAFKADWRVVECVCSDERVYRQRLAARKRTIPGGRELAWAEVERVRAYYALWAEEHLTIDSAAPIKENLKATLAYLRPEPTFAKPDQRLGGKFRERPRPYSLFS